MSSSIIKYGDKIKVSGYLTYSNGNVNTGCLVIVVKEENSVEIGRSATDSYGYYEIMIDNPSVGLHQIQYYGSGAIEKFQPDGNWEKFEITSDMLFDLNPLKYSTEPTLLVSEFGNKIDVNKNEISIINLTLNNLIPDDGTLTRAEIYYKLADDVTYKILTSYAITHTNSIDIHQEDILLENKPSYYDFYAILLDSVGNPYKEAGVVQKLENLNISLNGVPDVYEYIEGVDLEAINTSSPEDGELSDDLVKLKWTDLAGLKSTAFPIQSNDAFGRPFEITYEIAQKLENYVIFMYINKENIPPENEYPGLSAIYGNTKYNGAEWNYNNINNNGKWIFGGEFVTGSCELTVPRNYFVGFWMGFKSRKTQSNVGTEKIVY